MPTFNKPGLGRRFAALGIAAALTASCSSTGSGSDALELANNLANSRPVLEDAQLYFGGEIITMEGDSPDYVQSLVVSDGKIIFTGALDAARRDYPEATTQDLKGATLLPGFLDGHGHIYNAGFLSLTANLFPPPDGPAQDFDSLVQSVKKWAASEDGELIANKYGWIIGNGYDDSQLAEKAHPTAEVLDRISTELPILIIHQSGHLASMNSKAIELMGYDADTPDPKGGVFRRNADGSPNGVMEEAAFFGVAFGILSKTDPVMQSASLAKGQEQYASWGYTTAQEGRSSPSETGALSRAAQAGDLYLDIVAYPDMEFGISAMDSPYLTMDKSYSGHYRIGGAKLSLDGSPQGKTAWLTHPYHVPPSGQDSDYVGYPAMENEKAVDLVEKAFANGWQLLVHANGDAAIDQMIGAVREANALYPKADRRPVLIHGQTLRKDQVASLVEVGILPSLFPMHTYYWGDWHRDSVLGEARAARISPMREVLDAGLTVTSHHDAPVTFPNSMRVLDVTVNRTTRSGATLGPDQRLTPYEGLETLTKWAAIQYFEEGQKGTLSVGKLADLVILDHNPLTIEPSKIHTIRVVRTIKEGKTVWESSTMNTNGL